MSTSLNAEQVIDALSGRLETLYHQAGLKASEIFAIERPRIKAPSGDYNRLARNLVELWDRHPEKFTDRIFLLAGCAEIVAQLMIPHSSVYYSNLEAVHAIETKRLSAKVCLAALAIISVKEPKVMCPVNCINAKNCACAGECVESVLKGNKRLRDSWVESLCNAKHQTSHEPLKIIHELNDIRTFVCTAYGNALLPI